MQRNKLRCLCLFSILLLSGLNSSAQSSPLLCHQLFQSAHPQTALSPVNIKDVRIPNPDSFNPAIWKNKSAIEALRDFKGSDGSLQLIISHREKNLELAIGRISDALLFRLLKFTYNEIAGVKASIDFFKPLDKKTLFHAARNDWQAIQKVYNLLLLYNNWLHTLHPEFAHIDLTRKDDLLKMLGLSEQKITPDHWKTMEKEYWEHMESTTSSSIKNEQLVEKDNLLRQVNEYATTISIEAIFKPAGIGSFLKRKNNQDIADLLNELVKKLHLSPEAESKFIDNINYISVNQPVRAGRPENSQIQHQMGLIIYFINSIYHPRFPEIAPQKITQPLSTYAEFAKILATINAFDSFYLRQEIRFEEALSQIENFNLRISTILEDIQRGLEISALFPESHQRLHTHLEELRQSLNLLTIHDLAPDLVSKKVSELERLHFQIEKTLNEIFRIQQKSEIHNFHELSYQWELLIPDHPYALSGLDYDRVIFSKSVVDFFERNPEKGSYFLAALGKGYVGNKMYSGLRKITAIHTDFRDIKLLKHGGKVRIVGKLVGRTIHFFYIYDQDKPYEDGEMRKLINKFLSN